MELTPKKIAALDWTEDWVGSFCTLDCSYCGHDYFTQRNQPTKAIIPNILNISKKGFVTCYMIENEKKAFGKVILKQCVKDEQLFKKWPRKLVKVTNEAKKMFAQSPKNVFDEKKYFEFTQLLEELIAYYGAIKQVADHLPKKHEKYGKTLENARKHSDTVYEEFEKFLIKIAQLIGKKEGYPKELILSLTEYELSDYLKTKKLPSKQVLAERYEMSALYFHNGECQVLSGKKALDLENELKKKSKSLSKLTGAVAYPGFATGKCKIVVDPKKIIDYKEGNVLVSTLTRPDFLALIKKSCAVVTDAGGVLSHAAITCRELRIPCVIATKHATKAFKDGDLLQVDASKGIVKKIK